MKLRLLVEVDNDALSTDILMMAMRGSALETVVAGIGRHIYIGSSDLVAPGVDHAIKVTWKLTQVIPEAAGTLGVEQEGQPS